MPSISEVALTNTFDEWRTISNHLVTNVNAANSSDPTTAMVFANSTGGFAVNTVTTNTATGTLTTGTRLVFTGGNVNFSTSNVASLGNVHQVHILGGATVTGDSPSSSIANVQLNNSEINLNGKNFSANGSSTIDLENATISNLGTITTADINGGTIDGTAITCTGATDLLTLSQAGGSNPHVFTGAQISGGTFTGATQNAGLSHSSNVSVNGASFLATTNSTCLGLDAGASTNVAIGKFPEIDIARSGDTNHLPTSSKSRVHIRTDFAAGSAAATAVVASADELTIEGNTAVGMTLLSNTASNAHIAFGDSADADVGGIIYSHVTNQIHFVTSGANTVMFDDADGGCIQIPGGNALGTTRAKLHVNVGSSDATTGLFIDSNDADRIALEIDGEQTTMNVVSVDVDTLTSGHGLTVHSGIGTATTQAMTGSLFAVNDNNSSTNSRDIVGIVQEHASATGTTALSIRTDSGRGIFVNQDANNVALLVDAENDEADSVSIVSDALTTGSALALSSAAAHTGNLVTLVSDGAATGTTLYTRSDATTNTVNMLVVANSSSTIIEQETGGELTHKGKFMMPNLATRQGTGATEINYFPQVAAFATGGTPSNGVLIKTSLPFTNTIDQPIVKIEGYDYGGSRTIDLTIVFYVADGAFLAHSVSSAGGKAPAVKLCTWDSGNKIAISLGAFGYFTRFRVGATSTFGKSNANLETYYKGWDIAHDTGPTGANQVDVTYNSVIGPGLSVSGSIASLVTTNISGALTSSHTGTSTFAGIVQVNNETRANRVYPCYADDTSIYFDYPTGTYGTIQINGNGKNTWEGYSIDGRAVFMHNGSDSFGLYDDVNDRWAFQHHLSGGHAGETTLYYAGSDKLVTSSAGVTINGTITETSALALKENIEPITNSLSIIDNLQGVKYDWKDKEKFEDRRQIGLIAENVKEVIPEAEVDGTVSYTKLVGLLVEGIKDLNKEVNELKAKING